MRTRTMAAALVMAVLAAPVAAQPPAKPAEPPAGGYTPEAMIDALTKLGYEPTIYGTNKDRCWISLDRGTYRTTVNFSLSTDRTVLWFDCPLATVAFPAQSPPKALRRLLEENEKIGPAHFAMDSNDKRFHFQQANANRDWTPVRLRKEIEKFDDLLRKVEPIWRIDNFLRLAPVPEAVEAPERARLQGTWKLVEGTQNGVITPAEQLAKANVLVTIRENNLRASAQKLDWEFFLDPNHQPKAVDFVGSSKRVEAGIYKLEGDRLTIHLSAVAKERPANFSVPDGDKRSILVLQRQAP